MLTGRSLLSWVGAAVARGGSAASHAVIAGVSATSVELPIELALEAALLDRRGR